MRRAFRLNGLRTALKASSRRSGLRRKRKTAASSRPRSARFEALEERWVLSTVPGFQGDGLTSVLYNASTGEFRIQPDAQPVGLFQIVSSSAILTGSANLPFPAVFTANTTTEKTWAANPPSAFLSDFSLGVIAAPGLSQSFLLNDLTLVGSGGIGTSARALDLVYVSALSALTLATRRMRLPARGRATTTRVVTDNGPSPHDRRRPADRCERRRRQRLAAKRRRQRG